MNHVRNKQQGFTLVELSLAMTFISILLLAIALSIIQMGAMYNQGTTSKDINQASRDVNASLSRNISNAGPFVLADDYIQVPNASAPVGGRLCLGTVTYIWNYAKGIEADGSSVTKYNALPEGFDEGDQPQLVSVPDPGKIYCAKGSGGGLANKNIRTEDASFVQELLKPGDHSLGVHEFKLITPIPASASDAATGQQLYSVTYTIGTKKMSALNDTQTARKAPNLIDADPLYCNVQKFSLVVRAGNGVN